MKPDIPAQVVPLDTIILIETEAVVQREHLRQAYEAGGAYRRNRVETEPSHKCNLPGSKSKLQF